MNSSAHTRILALLCLTIGLGIFVYKTSSFQTPLTAEVQETVWDIELFIDFMARDEPVRVEAFIPGTAGGRQIAQEQFYNGAFGHRVVEGAALTEDGEVAPQNRLNRKSIWTYRYPNDRKILRYQGRITAQDGETPIAPFGKKAQANLLARIADDVKRQAFLVWSSDLQRQSADADSFAALVVEQIFSEQPSDEVLTLLKDLPPSTARLVLARNVLISQKIPARIANGVVLTGPMRQAQVQHWLEYAPDGVGLRYFPGEAPDRFFAIWFGEKPLIQADGAYELSAQISLSPVVVSGEIAAAMSGLATAPLVSWLRFDRLPLTTQLVYGVLVTIPVGITLLVFLRQFIGFQTLGTFMPVLIGIAFRETALWNGIFLFSLLVGLGLAARFYLERLKLLLVPRLAVILIFVVICMAAISLAAAGSGQNIGLSISLFPMVIMTMTIERMSIVWEEYSAWDAIKQGMGSLIVAALSYLVMSNNQVEYLMFHFPELLFVLMGLCLLMGKYTGLRLSELIRFRALAKRS